VLVVAGTGVKLSIGEVLIPVEKRDETCFGCCLKTNDNACGCFECLASERDDGKNVIYVKMRVEDIWKKMGMLMGGEA